MSSHKAITLFAICAIAPLWTAAQYVQLYSFSRTDALYLNPDRLVDYNLYEHVRIGAGLRYAHVGRVRSNGRVPLVEAETYAAYGVRDERWKAGVSLAYTAAHRHLWHPYAYAYYDLTPAASRKLESSHLSDLGRGALVAARRFAESGVAAVGLTCKPTSRITLGLETRWSHETPLYNNQAPLYLKEGLHHRDLGRGRYTEAVATLRHTAGLSAVLTVGYAHDIRRPFLRCIGQYSRSHSLGPLACSLYAQAGAASGGTPYSRLFDLGGCQGSPLALEQTLLTTRTGQFGGNLYGIATVRLATARPLVDWFSRDFQVGTRPVPFIQVGTAWSHLEGQDANGTSLTPRGETLPDGTRLDPIRWQALDHGIVELCAGIEGLVRVGLVAAGVAVAWRHTPPSASYHTPVLHDNLQLMLTASLVL